MLCNSVFRSSRCFDREGTIKVSMRAVAPIQMKRSCKLSEPYSFHVIADFESPRVIEDPAQIKRILWTAAQEANSTPLKSSVHKFPVQGVTGIVLLAESHISIHSWPEHNYLALDIFTCGRKTKPYKALRYLKDVFKPRRVKVLRIYRGKS